ncbi:DUF1634 domain-containing protein [Desulfonauticus submarinus]
MNKDKIDLTKPLPQQITYSNILFWGAWGGIALMTLTYILYVFHILPPHVDVNLVVQNWDKGVQEYMQITNSPHGWGWIFLLHKGDFINFLGIAMLALLTIVCYLVLIVGYLKVKDKLYATLAFLEVLVLTLAASGILGSGGH